MDDESNLPPCADCGHGYHAHYNATENPNRGSRPYAAKRKPCHHMGKHDSRCRCRNYRAPEQS